MFLIINDSLIVPFDHGIIFQHLWVISRTFWADWNSPAVLTIRDRCFKQGKGVKNDWFLFYFIEIIQQFFNS